ncbi:hypothetical protein BH09PAT2_BH09PAT2_02140 [soil metagenome]
MKSEFFSEEIFNSYINDLKKKRGPQDRLKKSQFIIDWLNWLKSKDVISQSEYDKANDKVKKHAHIRTNNISNVYRFVKKTNIYIFILFSFFIVIAICVTWYYKYHKNSTQQIYRTENNMSNYRVLPYKGRLLDDQSLPITSKKDITFRIYAAATNNKAIYIGACKGENAIEPDYTGNFTVVLGSDCGMSYIPESIFQGSKEIYLGVQLASEKELSPRQKISTSGYSSDAAKLQGLSLGSEKETIPFINQDGQVIFKHNDPQLKTTTGNFTIESPSMTLKTSAEDNGSIVFQPAAKGNTIIGTGKFGIGTFAPVNLLSINGAEPFDSIGSIKNLAEDDSDTLSVLKLSVGSNVAATESTFVKFYAAATTDGEGTEVGNIRLNNEGVAYESAGADFAEYFETDVNNIAPGFIMSLGSEGIHKSHKGEVVVGSSSDRAGFVGNKKNTSKNETLIALVGQVDVYVTDIEGHINLGDAVVLSDIPGYGAKGERGEESIGYSLKNVHESKKIICDDNIIRKYGKNIECSKITILLK